MGITSKITIAAILTLAIAGCASEDTQQAINPVPIPKIAKKSPPAAQSFKNPVIPAKQVSQVNLASVSLIQSTNATERRRELVVSKARSDPFAQLFGQTVLGMSKTSGRPVPVLPKLPTASLTVRKLPTRSIALNPKKNNLSSLPKKVNPKKVNPTLTSVLPKVLPQVVPNPTLVSVLPPPAQPDLARAVVVTGVVLISKEPQAIIKVPDEPTSRYVQAGQRLANGVLIKRIEMNQGYNPIVILEQYGIEVAKMVGEGTVKSTSSAASATGNAISVTTPLQNTFNVGAS
ncbi:hypothetical protein CDG76_16395 [Nostoc sp. 'Peltigera membranacea cyanobiont' 210A]|uniref:hypothetical protein n=1 Tax=Nostoc sp. 'Peltigera membranacea cyanobiont' 210A TaxID=2014529 RepID=UPI000B951BE6|nr:hypothetical protein [Nostoc sp. 'Peltigera membranacea cyanobiont' 210A]OYD93588.1 hypothetical protein CDG76_16395 [Nostoc sp. 'Peltigera membranacea cyanobiont' 210A]